MKAIVQDRFGPPDVLRLADTGLPEAGPDDVLVRVHAAALNPADWHVLRGDPLVARLMGVGLTRPKARVAGIDAAGVVESGRCERAWSGERRRCARLFPGRVRGVRVRRGGLGSAQAGGLTFEQAAAVPIAATTALRGIRDVGEVTAGQRVSSMGPARVGSYAVQIAAALGAEVTGVCSTCNARARALDRRRARHRLHHRRLHRRADAVRRDLRQRQPSAVPAAQGAHPEGDPRAQRWRFARPRVRARRWHRAGSGGRRVRLPAARPLPSRQNREELLAVTGLIEDGKLTPVVDRTYPLADTAEGLRYVEQGHARGKAVVIVA